MVKVFLKDTANEYEDFLELTNEQLTMLKWLEVGGYLGEHVVFLNLDDVEYEIVD